MAKCRFCGQPAGFFRSQHKECEAKRNAVWGRMLQLAQAALADRSSRSGLHDQLVRLAAEGFMDTSDVLDAMATAWEHSVTRFLEDGVLSVEEELELATFKDTLSLDQGLLDRHGALTRVVRAGVIRDLVEGHLPSRISFDGPLPFNLQKSERLIWVFKDVQYLEDRVRREYVGGYQGASIRVAKGLYWRIGGFRGHPVERTQRTHVDTGLVGVTNKHLYFVGPKKSLRIRHDKIISLIPFDDGIGVHRDAQTAKPQVFVTGDGWFTYNLMANASNVATPGA